MNKSKIIANKLFWFLRRNGVALEPSRDRHLIINQTLAMGSMDDIQKLFHEYDKETIREEFRKPAAGLYAPAVLHFFEYILDVQLNNSEQYIKKIHGKPTPGHS